MKYKNVNYVLIKGKFFFMILWHNIYMTEPLREKLTVLEQLKSSEGYYCNLLERYASGEFSYKNCLRDLLQNFYDANIESGSDRGTLDSVFFEASEIDGRNVFRIIGSHKYDFKYLLALGSGDKSSQRHSAGGFGEGTKIVALTLIRDYNCRVIYSSDNWQLEFYLNQIPQDKFPEGSGPKRGLFAKLTYLDKPFSGNTVTIVRDGGTIEDFYEVKDMFYHSQNKDFQPSEESIYADIPYVGGFKIKKKTNAHAEFEKGSLYICGQKIMNLNGLSLWTWKKPSSIQIHRNRPELSEQDILQKIIPMICDFLPNDEKKRIFLDILEIIYSIHYWNFEKNAVLLSLFKNFVSDLVDKNIRINIPRKFRCVKSNVDCEALNRNNPTFCFIPIEELKNLGMIFHRGGSPEREYEFIKEISLTEAEKLFTCKIEDYFSNFLSKMKITLRSYPFRIRYYTGNLTPLGMKQVGVPYININYDYLKNLKSGDYTSQTYFLQRLIVTYLHECSHGLGYVDDSEEFSEELKHLNLMYLNYIKNYPEDFEKFKTEIRLVLESLSEQKES